jgi:hypothetical protein
VETIPEEARDSEQEEEERLALIETDVQLAHPVIANGELACPLLRAVARRQWRRLQMKRKMTLELSRRLTRKRKDDFASDLLVIC